MGHAPAHLGRCFPIHWDEGKLRMFHALEALLAQRRVMTSVVTDFVEDSAAQQIGSREFALVAIPAHLVPGKPIAHLGVSRKQKHFVVLCELDREHETGVIGVGIEPERERADPGKVHPHRLRHACGYALANKGHDLRIIQDYPGHRDPKHTALYTRTAAKRFENLWR
jgi:hypothetical protein